VPPAPAGLRLLALLHCDKPRFACSDRRLRPAHGSGCCAAAWPVGRVRWPGSTVTARQVSQGGL